MKTEVYSWRVSPELKSDLEREARRRKISLSAALDLAAQEWLEKNCANSDDELEQKRLHQAASKFFGVLSIGGDHTNEGVRKVIRERLRQRYVR